MVKKEEIEDEATYQALVKIVDRQFSVEALNAPVKYSEPDHQEQSHADSPVQHSDIRYALCLLS